MFEESMNIVLHDVTFASRNFTGRASKYFPVGTRAFTLVIPNTQVSKMLADGWTVKKATLQGDIEVHYLNVYLASNFSPSSATLNHRPFFLPEELEAVDKFKNRELKVEEVSIMGWPWEVNGRKGVKNFVRHIDIVTV